WPAARLFVALEVRHRDERDDDPVPVNVPPARVAFVKADAAGSGKDVDADWLPTEDEHLTFGQKHTRPDLGRRKPREFLQRSGETLRIIRVDGDPDVQDVGRAAVCGMIA